jgi:hypothetical protein
MIDFMQERLHKVKYYARRANITKKAQTLEVGLITDLIVKFIETRQNLYTQLIQFLHEIFHFVKGLTTVPEPWGTTPNQYIQDFRGLPRKHIMYICQ